MFPMFPMFPANCSSASPSPETTSSILLFHFLLRWFIQIETRLERQAHET